MLWLPRTYRDRAAADEAEIFNIFGINWVQFRHSIFKLLKIYRQKPPPLWIGLDWIE